MSCELWLEIGKRRVEVSSGINLLQAAKEKGISILSLCGGKGRCGRCKVVVEKGGEYLGPYTEAEGRHLSPEEISSGCRLACALTLPDIPYLRIRVPQGSLITALRLQTEGAEVPIEPHPLVKKYLLQVSGKGEADEDGLLKALAEHGLFDPRLTYEACLQLPQAIREANGVVTAVIWEEKEIIALEAGDTTDRCYGLAVDIGTTKLAGFLLSLSKGKVIALSSLPNPQMTYGEDIMTRMELAMEEEGLALLQREVIKGINEMIEDLCQKAKIRPEEIYEACVAGNTCMSHLFLGISPRYLALAPYPPVIRRGINLEARKLNLRIHPQANLYVMPTIAGFVGRDNVSVQLAVSHLEQSSGSRLILDIGTNTEILLEDEGGE